MRSVTRDDRRRWDARHAAGDLLSEPSVPEWFAPFEAHLPQHGLALDLACGRGQGAVWLAERGLEVRAVDVSTVAVERARRLAEARGVQGRCAFDVFDL